MLCLMYFDVRVMEAKSIEQIRWANSINLYIMSVVISEPTDYIKVERLLLS